jgi:hypothetical protein
MCSPRPQVLDSTKAFKRLVTDVADVAGLPATALGLAAQQAKGAGHEAATPEAGPWCARGAACALVLRKGCRRRGSMSHAGRA